MQKKSITVKELADLTKLTPRTIGRYFKNEAKIIKFDTVNKLCKALDCDLNDLLTTSNEKLL